MKKILTILLTVIIIATIFIGCSKESEPVNGTTEPTSVETVDEIVDNFTEDVSIEDTTTDENGNEIVVGKDKDGNTVEIKTDSNGNVTKTVTDKDTGKKTEQTATVTTKKQETTTKKKSEDTTKKPETTTKKPTQNATTKPTSQQTTSAHTHNFVKKSKQVLVKAAYDEDIYETKQKMVERQSFYCSGCHVDCILEAQRLGYANYEEFHMSHILGWDGLSCPRTYGNGDSTLLGQAIGQPNSKMYPVYENGKPVYEKVKTGTKHHDAEYRTEYWEECSCGAKR